MVWREEDVMRNSATVIFYFSFFIKYTFAGYLGALEK